MGHISSVQVVAVPFANSHVVGCPDACLNAVAMAIGAVITYKFVRTAQRCSSGNGMGVFLILVAPLKAATISSTRLNPSCSSCCVSTSSTARSAIRDDNQTRHVSAWLLLRLKSSSSSSFRPLRWCMTTSCLRSMPRSWKHSAQ